MTIVITWPTDQTKSVTDAIREAIGRDITWYVLASSTECPDCSLDEVTGTSTDSFCETCSGLYYIPVYSGHITTAHITWGQAEQFGWVTGGQLEEGECRVQIEFTDENEDAVDGAAYVIVDGRRMQKTGKSGKKLRGFKDINRILIDLEEEEKE